MTANLRKICIKHHDNPFFFLLNMIMLSLNLPQTKAKPLQVTATAYTLWFFKKVYSNMPQYL